MAQKYVIKKAGKTIDLRNSHKEFDKLKVGSAIPVTINSAKMTTVAAIKMYTSWESGVRELYANACRAARDAAEAGNSSEAHVSINVRHDNDGTVLVISDNGPGMDLARFEESFSEIGTSDNMDPSKPGQFGMGVISFMLLGEKARFDTMYDGPDGPERYAVTVGEDLGITYEGGGDRQSRGTTVTVRCTKPEPWFNAIVSYVEETAKLSGVRTTLDADKWGSVTTTEFPALDAAAYYEMEAGVRPLVNISRPEYDLAAGCAVDCRSFSKTALAGMPVRMDFEPGYNLEAFVLNIKDERRFMPHPNREKISEEGSERLAAMLKKDVDAAVKKLAALPVPPVPKTYDELCDVDGALVLWRGPVNGRKERPVNERLYTDAIFNGNSKTILAIALKHGRNVVYSMKDRMNSIELEEELKTTIIWGERSPAHAIARDLGITQIRDAARKAGVRLTERQSGSDVPLSDIVHRGRLHDPRKLPKTTVMAPPSCVRDVRNAIRSYFVPDKIAWIKHVPALVGHPNVIMFEDWIEKLGGVKLRTNRGVMSVRDIAKEQVWSKPRFDGVDKKLTKEDAEWLVSFPHTVLYEDGKNAEKLHMYAMARNEHRPMSLGIRIREDWKEEWRK